MPTTRATPVFFCGRTAFQIARAAQEAGRILPAATLREAPARAPLKDEVTKAIACAEARFPGLSLSKPVHVLVGGRAHCRPSRECVSHRCSGTLARKSFYRLDVSTYACTPAAAFLCEAACAPSDIALLELAFELCGTYRSLLTCDNPSYNVPALLSGSKLRSFAQKSTSAKGAAKAQRLSKWIADGSASPRETKLALILSLPRTQGGAGLGMPQMNFEVAATREAMLIAHRASFRCDVCWPEARIDVEYQSREMHTGESMRISDSERTNALRSMGWTVVGITNSELEDMRACDAIARTIGKHIGKDMRVRIAGYHEKEQALRAELDLPTDSWVFHAQ